MNTYVYLVNKGIKRFDAEENVILARAQAEARFGKDGELFKRVPDPPSLAQAVVPFQEHGNN